MFGEYEEIWIMICFYGDEILWAYRAVTGNESVQLGFSSVQFRQIHQT